MIFQCQHSSSKVTIATSSNLQSTSSPLADTLPAIMEEILSPIIVSVTSLVARNNSLTFMHSLIHDNFSHNQADQHTEQDDRDGCLSDATTNISMSRGRRQIKPLQRFKDMD